MNTEREFTIKTSSVEEADAINQAIRNPQNKVGEEINKRFDEINSSIASLGKALNVVNMDLKEFSSQVLKLGESGKFGTIEADFIDTSFLLGEGETLNVALFRECNTLIGEILSMSEEKGRPKVNHVIMTITNQRNMSAQFNEDTLLAIKGKLKAEWAIIRNITQDDE